MVDTGPMASRIHTPKSTTAPDCPRSETRGKRVENITLESLLQPQERRRIASSTWFYCPEGSCSVVYFNGGGECIEKHLLGVRVGTKESGPPRPICYCFEHTIEDIDADVARDGSSEIPNSITEKCRQGLHRCEETNPQGTCCLGSVRRVLKEAQARASQPVAEQQAEDCCAVTLEGRSSTQADDDCCSVVPPSTSATPTAGRFAALAALATAAMSSACCWLPLLLLTFGASAAGVAGFFERYRPLFLGASGVLLALGFYLVYARAPRCEPGDFCAAQSAKLARLNKVMLWVAAAAVGAFAMFPHYVGNLLGAPGNTTEFAVASDDYDMEFAVEGMTCEACAVTLKAALVDLPGVRNAWVGFAQGSARLQFDADVGQPSVEAIAKTVRHHGYTAVLPPNGVTAAK